MTEPAFKSSVATVTATSTVTARYRVAKASVMSWLLSPISARKMMTKERTKASMDLTGFAGLGTDRLTDVSGTCR